MVAAVVMTATSYWIPTLGHTPHMGDIYLYQFCGLSAIITSPFFQKMETEAGEIM